MNSRRRRGGRVLLTIGLACAAGPTGCDDEPGPRDAAPQPVDLQPGANVYLVVSTTEAAPGEEIRIEARVSVGGAEMTPTAFVARLRYDPGRLVLIESVPLDDKVVRAANLAAGPGLARFAGAAAAGIGSETLFGVRARVARPGYAAGLAVELDELDVLEGGVRDVAAQTHVSARVYVEPRIVR